MFKNTPNNFRRKDKSRNARLLPAFRLSGNYTALACCSAANKSCNVALAVVPELVEPVPELDAVWVAGVVVVVIVPLASVVIVVVEPSALVIVCAGDEDDPEVEDEDDEVELLLPSSADSRLFAPPPPPP